MKNKIIELLKDGELSIDTITSKLGIDNIYKTMSFIAELEYEGKVIHSGMKTCYKPDGCAFYIALYGLKNNKIDNKIDNKGE